MKKSLLILASFALTIVACKTQSAVSSSTSAPAAYSADADLSKVKNRFPDATADQIKDGHDLYYGACTDCHRVKNISAYNEDELSHVLDRMARKAKLNAVQKDDVWKYMVALRSK